MENKTTNIFEKILYGQKVTNDNIVILNEKIDVVLKMLTVVEETGPDASGTEQRQ